MNFSDYIIPIFIISIIVYSVVTRKNAYNSFVFGAKTSFDLVLTSFPYIVAIFIAIEIFNVSGLGDMVSTAIAPVFNLVGIPKELCGLVIIKLFSGCGGLAYLENIFATYGVDSYLARAGCAIAGCSEAIFYVLAVYFVNTKVKKYRYAIFVAMLANIVGAIVACQITKVL